MSLRPIRSVRPENLKENSFTDEIETSEDSVNENVIVDAISYSMPSTSQNAPHGGSLDLCKQYKRRADYCDRDLIRIHDKSKNKKDGGSEDKGLIYIDFNAAIFEALKINLLKCLEQDYDTILTLDPKMEFYGDALERICIDLQMKVNHKTYDIKLKIYNTKCSIDVARQKGTLNERIENLFNLTVGEYFAMHVIAKIVEKINQSFDITKLNMHLKKLANEGKKAAKTKASNKKHCKECKKDVKNSKNVQCLTCKESTHFNCLPSEISDARKEIMLQKNEFQCGICRVYPDQVKESETDEITIIDTLKQNLVLPDTNSTTKALIDLTSEKELVNEEDPYDFKCFKCDFRHKVKHNLEDHVAKNHEFICNLCDISFDEKTNLENHDNEVHNTRGTKRHRFDTSLLLDPRPCPNCEISNTELENMKKNQAKVQEELEEANKKLDKANIELNDCKTELETVKKEASDSNKANKVLETELSKCNEELVKLKAQPSELQEAISKKDEDYQLIKQMVVDRDKKIKKLEESHKKDLDDLRMQKRASDDDLNIAVQENTKMKDKETTLMDIFKCMKKYLDGQDNFFPCNECELTFDKADKLNLHKRSHHLSMSLRCGKCKFEAKSASNHKEHTKTHSATSSIFSCEECGYADQIEENLLNHKIAKHSVHICDICDEIFAQEKELDLHKLSIHKQQSSNLVNCDECGFSDSAEENILNHKISKHSMLTCDLCDFKCPGENILSAHIQSIHNVTKHSCNLCQKTFSNLGNLKRHIKSHQTEQTYNCDYCGYKAGGLGVLDEHIETYHRIKKASNTRFSNAPCDFRNPTHSSKCCDRDQGPKMKIYTPEQRINNGPYRNWNENFCRFSELCMYAHIEPCRFQNDCFAQNNCPFFHFNRNNAPFLGGKVFRSQSFKLNPKEFPPLQKPGNQRRNL